MRERVTSIARSLMTRLAPLGGSVLEVTSLVAIVAGVAVLLGTGWALVAGGLAGLLLARAVA